MSETIHISRKNTKDSKKGRYMDITAIIVEAYLELCLVEYLTAGSKRSKKRKKNEF
jgi:hypothetical protein